MTKRYSCLPYVILVLLFVNQQLYAQSDSATIKQSDSSNTNKIDSMLSRPKGLWGQITHILLADTSIDDDETKVQRNDFPFLKYEGRIIRHIIIQSLEFGTLTKDTVRRIDKKLAHIANEIHYKTRVQVVRNNLFFNQNEKLSPYLLANNERYLRDLPYLREARILVHPLRYSDSVDVIVITKDVLSLSGSLRLRNSKSAIVEMKEDNFFGWGDRIEFQTLYDGKRKTPFGYGGEYIKRNIAGSFIDANAGYLNFDKSLNTGKRQERVAFLQMVKPLVNPYMLWTYAFNVESHASDNMFYSDSLYDADIKYKYQLYDAWAGVNLSTKMIDNENEFKRLRYLLSTRVFDRKFLDKPAVYANQYYYAYANLFAVLSSISVFQLNYYKTKFIYGFGRNEDLPEGLDASVTAGWTRKENRERPYAAVNFQRYFFTRSDNYFNFSLSAGSHFYNSKFEDITLFGNLDFFSRLRQIGPRWKHRCFINVTAGKQYNTLLDEPFLLESRFGLPEFKNNSFGGSMRATIKAESVFFSPWSILYFKFAPFIFGSATAFKQSNNSSNAKIYPAVGGGVRTRNESLIFGTVEVRGVYLPKPDWFGHRYIFQLNTNLRFKYIQNFVRRPEFIQIN